MIAELVEVHGVENVKVTIGSLPIQIMGIIAYTSSNDETVSHEHSLVEQRYKIADRYKIEFEPVADNGKVYAPRAMYQTDLDQMIRSGHAAVRVIIEEQVA